MGKNEGGLRPAAYSPVPHSLMRWSPCWYGQAAVNRPDAGSIPAAAAESGCGEVGRRLWEEVMPIRPLPTAYSPIPHDLLRKSSELVRSLSRKQVASSARLWVRLPRLPLSSPLAPREERDTIGDLMSGGLPSSPCGTVLDGWRELSHRSSRGARWLLKCPWPSGKGTGPPTRTGEFDSRRALWGRA